MSAHRPILSHMHVLVQFMKGGLAVQAGQRFERNWVQNIPFLSNCPSLSTPAPIPMVLMLKCNWDVVVSADLQPRHHNGCSTPVFDKLTHFYIKFIFGYKALWINWGWAILERNGFETSLCDVVLFHLEPKCWDKAMLEQVIQTISLVSQLKLSQVTSYLYCHTNPKDAKTRSFKPHTVYIFYAILSKSLGQGT